MTDNTTAPERIWAVFEPHKNPKDKTPRVYASASQTKGKEYILKASSDARVAELKSDFIEASDKAIHYATKYSLLIDRTQTAEAELANARAEVARFRHSVAVRMLQAGQPIEAVAQYLGHSNTAITYRTYARFMPEHLAGAAEILNFDTMPRRAK